VSDGAGTDEDRQTDTVATPLPPEVIRAMQEAALDLIATARHGLDVLEAAIEDEDKVAAFVCGLTDVLRFASGLVTDFGQRAASSRMPTDSIRGDGGR
jgi:hypothetical protein